MKNLRRAAMLVLCLFPMLCVPLLALPVQLQDPTTQKYIGGTSTPIPTTGGGVAQASIINTTAAIAASDTAIALAGSPTHVVIKTDTGASPIYVNLTNTTATTGNFKIDAGGSFYYSGAPLAGFHYLGANATGNISYCAW